MKHLFLPILFTASITGPAFGEIVLTYDAGIPAVSAATGAADPTAQGWTFTGLAGNQFAAGYDSGNGGWRTVDGTGTGPANYSQTLGATEQAKLTSATDWTIEWTVALDKDALGSGGATVTDYYLGRTDGNLVMLIDLAAGGLGYFLTLEIDGANNLVITDSSGGSGSYDTGLDVTAFPNFGTFSLVHDNNTGTAILDYGAGNVALTPGAPLIGGRNSVFFGAGSSGGQGSAVWNEVTVSIPDPVPGNQLSWTGLTNGTWDSVTSNWQLADNSPTAFTDGDDVTLDDTASTGNITISGAQAPGSVVINNDTLAYQLGGDPLTGLMPLTKQGPGSLTLTGTNTYGGSTSIEAGSVVAGDGATSGEIGAGAVSIASGASLTISRSDLLDYKATPKLRTLSGAGDLILDGGGLLFSYPGGGLGFNATDTWAGFSGDITLINGSELQTIRNGATALGSGTLILGDATSSGNLSPTEGNWTWTNPISVVGPDNEIRNRAGGADRNLKLQGPISGAGALTLTDPANAMTNLNRGFIITDNVTLTGELTIDAGTPVRIGGIPGEDTSLAPDNAGSLGTTTVVNDGVLTFSRTDSHTLSAPISGLGDVRIGLPSSAGLGDTSSQVATINDATKTYTGVTTVESGTLLINGTLPDSQVDVNPEGILGGTGTVSDSTLALGTIAPGTSVGTLTFANELLFVGGSSYAWEVSDFTGSAGSDYDTLSTITIEFLDASLLGPATAANPVTIVVQPLATTNFSETATTFILATASFPITQFDPEGFAVDDSAFSAATGSAGSWAVALSSDGLSVELVYTPGDPNAFSTWISGFYPGENDPAVVGFDADPDGDGVGNGVENFLGTAPNAFSPGLQVTSANAAIITATHSQSNDIANDVNGAYEWSTDLASWNASGNSDPNGVTATITSLITDDQESPENDTVQVTATVTAGSAGRLFLRAVASQSAP